MNKYEEFDFLHVLFMNSGLPFSFKNSKNKKVLYKMFVPQSDVVSTVYKFNVMLPYFGYFGGIATQGEGWSEHIARTI